ncbi:hypothetical protein CXB51_026218 [Gossypium anomalum]|uniref:Integrase catalytic domain-containing protein n=1 Tax=Gossypium anomalum TaxID=47600 RepID=A0A8J5Y2U9_9ROSI|nr:hypothetical protein CXB51_026218 [Gossypium anomalum]
MEVQYDKEDLGLILICSLPPSYSTFRDTILYSRESLTVDEIGMLIMIVEGHRNGILAVNLRNKIKSEATNQKGKQPENSSEADVVEDYSDGELLVASVNDSKVNEEWILGLGCIFHMSPNRDWFTTYETVSKGVILMGNNASCKISGLRTIKVKMFDRVGSTVTGDAAVASSFLLDDDITKLWHMRLGHMSENGLVELSKRELLDGQGICKLNFCEHCVFGKQKRVRFTRGILNTKGTLKYIHSDLWGLSRVPLRGGANYILTFIDDFSRKVWVFFLKQKSDVFSSEGIVRHLTVRHTPQQNGIVEQMNRTIMEKVQCMLSNANLPKSFWAETTSTACFLINRSPSIAIDKKTPQEVWSGNPGNYSDLKIFGCPVYTHVDNGKLDSRSIKCVFLGYKAGVKGYKLWCPENRKVEHQINTEPTPQASTKIENRVAPSPQYSITKSRTRREIKPPKKYAEADLVAYALNVAEDIDANRELSNYSEVISCEDSGKWMFAMQEEMESLHKKRTWDLVKLSKVVDFIDVFSPVVKHSSIRALLGIVAMDDLELEQLDVKTVFLHGELEEDNYMQQPEGFTVLEKEDYVCLLKKSLYGHQDCGTRAAKDKGEIRKVKAQLSEELEMKDLGLAKKMLGMEILSDRKTSKLYQSQKGYIEKVLCRFNMQSAKSVSTLLAAHFRLSSALSPQSDDEIKYMSHVPYSSAVGSLMYAMVCSRPDLAFAFGRTEDGVIGYIDANFAGDLDRRRSLTGYVFTIGGCAISWKAALQTTATLSTTEAEYIVITEACKEAIWLKGLFSELNEDLQINTAFCDSQSAIFLTKD